MAIYMAAIVGAIAVFAVPVYYATRAEVYENPPLARADPLLNGPIIGKRVSERVPLARLQRQTLIDPAIVAALNAKAEKLNAKAEKTAAHRPSRTASRRARGTPVADLQPERRRPTFFLFDLFGG